MSLPRALETILTFANDMAQWLITTQRLKVRWIAINPVNKFDLDWLYYANGYLFFQLRPIALLASLMGVLFILMLIKKVVPVA